MTEILSKFDWSIIRTKVFTTPNSYFQSIAFLANSRRKWIQVGSHVDTDSTLTNHHQELPTFGSSVSLSEYDHAHGAPSSSNEHNGDIEARPVDKPNSETLKSDQSEEEIRPEGSAYFVNPGNAEQGPHHGQTGQISHAISSASSTHTSTSTHTHTHTSHGLNDNFPQGVPHPVPESVVHNIPQVSETHQPPQHTSIPSMHDVVNHPPQSIPQHIPQHMPQRIPETAQHHVPENVVPNFPQASEPHQPPQHTITPTLHEIVHHPPQSIPQFPHTVPQQVPQRVPEVVPNNEFQGAHESTSKPTWVSANDGQQIGPHIQNSRESSESSESLEDHSNGQHQEHPAAAQHPGMNPANFLPMPNVRPAGPPAHPQQQYPQHHIPNQQQSATYPAAQQNPAQQQRKGGFFSTLAKFVGKIF